MKIRIQNATKESRRLKHFLEAIAVNKGLCWTAHFATALKSMQSFAAGKWMYTIGQEDLSWDWSDQKAQRGLSQEFGVYSGQTKAQATLTEGSAELHLTGRGNVLTQIAAPAWTPAPGEPPWQGRKHKTDRPFWQLNGQYSFFDQTEIVQRSTKNYEIFKTYPSSEVTLSEAIKSLIISVARAKKILKKEQAQLGSWKKSKLKGVAARWL